MDAAARRSAVLDFALGLPWATEDQPWGDVHVVKVEKRDVEPPPWRRHLVHGPVFLWLGAPDATTISVKLRDGAGADAARSLAGAVPTTASGLGQWGWLDVTLTAVDLDLLCDWVEESYRNVAPKKLVRRLDEECERRD